MQDITVIIPTMLKAEKRMFQYLINEILENEFVKKLIIIDNTGEKLFKENFSVMKKMQVIENDKNVGVNPAWNQGMAQCDTEFYCIINDDILCERLILSDLLKMFLENPDVGVSTVFAADPRIHAINQENYRLQKVVEDRPIEFQDLPMNRYDGWFFFGRSKDWIPIDERLRIFYGDNFIFCVARNKKQRTVILTSRFIIHEVSTTCIATSVYTKGILEEEGKIWKEIYTEMGFDNAVTDVGRVIQIEDAEKLDEKKITLCMIVKDEEKNLKRCLESVQGIVDEIVIIDTGSSDNTTMIARKYTPKVFIFPWNGSFADARNESLKYATGDWIFVIDADEVVAVGKRRDFLKLANVPLSRPVSYQFKIRNAISKDEGVEHFVARFFPNNFDIKFQGSIHEFLTTDKNLLNVPTEKVILDHYGYDKETVVSKDKINRNVTSLLKELEKDPSSPFYLYHLGLTYRVSGEHEKALETFEKWDKIIFDNHKIDVSMGYSAYIGELVTSKRDADAVVIYEKVRERCLHNPDFLLNSAIAQEHIGKYEIAEDLLRRCIATKDSKSKSLSYDKDSNGWKALAVLGNILARKNNHKEAVEMWEKAFNIKGSNKELYKAMVSSSIYIGDLVKAEKYILLLFKDFPEEKNMESASALANIMIKKGAIQPALDLLKDLPNFKEAVDQLLTQLISANNFSSVKKIDDYMKKLDEEKNESVA